MRRTWVWRGTFWVFNGCNSNTELVVCNWCIPERIGVMTEADTRIAEMLSGRIYSSSPSVELRFRDACAQLIGKSHFLLTLPFLFIDRNNQQRLGWQGERRN